MSDRTSNLVSLIVEARLRAEDDLMAVGHARDSDGRTRAMADLRQWIERLKAAEDRPAVETSPWQPIETAPKDGTRILVYNCVVGVYGSAYEDGEWPLRYWHQTGVWYPRPNLWMPFPNDPGGVMLNPDTQLGPNITTAPVSTAEKTTGHPGTPGAEGRLPVGAGRREGPGATGTETNGHCAFCDAPLSPDTWKAHRCSQVPRGEGQ